MKKVGLYEECFDPFSARKYHSELEYTGRWKIVLLDGSSTLYIECFEFKDKEVCPSVLQRILGAKKKKTILSVRKRGWMKEDYLHVIETEEFINTCGETNG